MRSCHFLSFQKIQQDLDDKFRTSPQYVNENCHLCAEHFDDSQFCDPELKNKLIANAIPTIFPESVTTDFVTSDSNFQYSDDVSSSQEMSYDISESGKESNSKHMAWIHLVKETLKSKQCEPLEMKEIIPETVDDIHLECESVTGCEGLPYVEQRLFKHTIESVDSLTADEVGPRRRPCTKFDNLTRERKWGRALTRKKVEIFRLRRKLNKQFEGVPPHRISMLKSMVKELTEVSSPSVSDEMFSQRCCLLRQLFEIWKKGEDVDLQCNDPLGSEVNDLVRSVIKVEKMEAASDPSAVKDSKEQTVYVQLLQDPSDPYSATVVSLEAAMTGSYSKLGENSASGDPPPRRKPGEPVIPFACSQCSKEFQFHSQLEIHLKQHTGERPYACEVCDRRFTFRATLEKHMGTHSDDKPYQCSECGKRFGHMNYLNAHMRLHTGERPYSCDVCRRSFAHATSLRNHASTHRNTPDTEKPLACDVCKNRFKNAQSLKTHLRVHGDERQYKCASCDKSFSQMASLKRHRVVHGDPPPENNARDPDIFYACEYCSRGFSTVANLKRHIMTHTGEKLCECHVCNKQFTQFSNLKAHMRVHTGERPYLCNGCGKSFAEATTLRKHCLNHCGRRQEQSVTGENDLNFGLTTKFGI